MIRRAIIQIDSCILCLLSDMKSFYYRFRHDLHDGYSECSISFFIIKKSFSIFYLKKKNLEIWFHLSLKIIRNIFRVWFSNRKTIVQCPWTQMNSACTYSSLIIIILIKNLSADCMFHVLADELTSSLNLNQLNQSNWTSFLSLI